MALQVTVPLRKGYGAFPALSLAALTKNKEPFLHKKKEPFLQRRRIRSLS